MARWLMHDIRNPSQALTLIAELMQGIPDPEDEPPAVTIREATRHLVRSVEILDRVLRVPPKGSEPEPAPVSLRDQLEFLGALHRIHRTPVRLDLSHALDPGLPAVAAVADDLEHALLALLLNALEACADRHGGRIRLSTAVTGDQVSLTLSDNGNGVADEVRGRLFEPFVTTKKDQRMAGLGLWVARGMLSRAGGTVEVAPGGAEGTAVVVTLRAWKPPSGRHP